MRISKGLQNYVNEQSRLIDRELFAWKNAQKMAQIGMVEENDLDSGLVHIQQR
jgi:hypothetical protein